MSAGMALFGILRAVFIVKDLYFGVDQLFVGEAQYVGQFVYQVILKLVQFSIDVDNTPKSFDDVDLFLGRVIFIYESGKVPVVDAPFQFLFGGSDQLVGVFGRQTVFFLEDRENFLHFCACECFVDFGHLEKKSTGCDAGVVLGCMTGRFYSICSDFAEKSFDDIAHSFFHLEGSNQFRKNKLKFKNLKNALLFSDLKAHRERVTPVRSQHRRMPHALQRGEIGLQIFWPKATRKSLMVSQ